MGQTQGDDMTMGQTQGDDRSADKDKGGGVTTDKFLYVSGLRLCYGGGGTADKRESDYINNYRKSIIDSAKQKDWKTSGQSAAFQGRAPETADLYARITGISPYRGGSFLYAAFTHDISGILQKDCADGREQYLIHDNKYVFSHIAYVPEADMILTSVTDNPQTNHIGRFDCKTNDLEILTAGDAFDEYPSYHDGKIYFSSRGIGRDAMGRMTGYGQSSLFTLDKDNRCEEVLSERGFDLIAPQMDGEGNLYYIRKPYKPRRPASVGFGDVLLFPFRLLYNVFRALFFISRIGQKSDKRNQSATQGADPAVSTEFSERDLYIYGEQIRIREEENAARRRQDKNAGFAPARFELYKRAPDGAAAKIKSGVLSYDLDGGGGVVYTNGRYIIKLQKDGTETALHKDGVITAVKLDR